MCSEFYLIVGTSFAECFPWNHWYFINVDPHFLCKTEEATVMYCRCEMVASAAFQGRPVVNITSFYIYWISENDVSTTSLICQLLICSWFILYFKPGQIAEYVVKCVGFVRNTEACCLYDIQWNMALYATGMTWNASGTISSPKNSCKQLPKRYFLMSLTHDMPV